MPYDVGDNVFCKVLGTTVISRTEDTYETILSFEIIGFDESNNSYIAYVPDYYNIRNRIRLQEAQVQEYNLPSSFVHRAILLIKNDHILYIRKAGMDGMYCCQCGAFYPWAQANQPDGSLKCYQCRQDPYR